MEGLVRLVAQSLERHGMSVPPERIDWSAWMPLESTLCLTAPSNPGLFVVAESFVPHSMTADSSALAILKVGQTKDLGVEIARLCFHSPLRDRIAAGHCLIRFAKVEDDAQAVSACAALQQWFSNTNFQAEPVLANSAHQQTTSNPAPLPSGF